MLSFWSKDLGCEFGNVCQGLFKAIPKEATGSVGRQWAPARRLQYRRQGERSMSNHQSAEGAHAPFLSNLHVLQLGRMSHTPLAVYSKKARQTSVRAPLQTNTKAATSCRDLALNPVDRQGHGQKLVAAH
jgi:hypothetical protein